MSSRENLEDYAVPVVPEKKQWIGFYLCFWSRVTRLSIQHLAQKWVQGEIHRSCSARVERFIFTSPPKGLAASATFLLENDTLHSGLEPFTPSARRTPRGFVVGDHETGNLHGSICRLCHHYSIGQDGHPHVMEIINFGYLYLAFGLIN